MVLLHLRSSQAEFDAYLLATHGIKKNQFTLNDARATARASGDATTFVLPHRVLVLYVVLSPRSGGLSNYLPTWLAPAGQKSNYLPTYLCITDT